MNCKYLCTGSHLARIDSRVIPNWTVDSSLALHCVNSCLITHTLQNIVSEKHTKNDGIQVL